MPNRHIQDANNYRYAYQGQEKDPETGKEAFELRLWDGRIGRWLTTDPYGQYHSPYLGMGNNPIKFIDPDGGYCTDSDGNSIPCPDGYSSFEGPTIEPYVFDQWDDGTWFYNNPSNQVKISNGIFLDNNGYSQNPAITVDIIDGLMNGRPNMSSEIEGIVLHRTVSTSYPGSWMKSHKKIKGAHFYIAKDGTIYQTASLNISVAHIWATGSKASKQMYPGYYNYLFNTNTIGIEVVGHGTNEGVWEPLTTEQINSTKKLIILLKHKYICCKNLYPHEDIQRKTKMEGGTVLNAISN